MLEAVRHLPRVNCLPFDQQEAKMKSGKLFIPTSFVCVLVFTIHLFLGLQVPKAQAASEDPIPIGVLVPYSGELSNFGEYVYKAAMLATEEINEAGGPLDRQIKISTEDSESSVEQGIRGARKLITGNGVIAINGPTSTVVTSILNFARDNKVVVASPYAGSTKLDKEGGKYQFRTCPSDSFDGKASAQMLWDEGFKRIAILHANDEGRTSIAEAMQKEFESIGGEVVAKVSFSGQKSTYLSELKKVYKDDPEILFLAAGQESGPTIIKDWDQRGYGEDLMVTADLAIPEFFDLVPADIAQGVLAEMPISEEKTKQFKRFSQKWREKYDSEAGGAYQANTYDAQIILALAIEAAGEATGEGIAENYRKIATPPGKKVYSFAEGVEELRKGNDINYEGASGPCDFDKYGNVSGSYALLKAEDGKWDQYRFYEAKKL